MEEKTNLKKIFSTLQDKMIANVNLSKIPNHPTDKGDNVEKSWLRWFGEYLPKRYRTAKATVIDCKGNISDQIDIVLYDGQYSYLVFNQNDTIYVPAESVYAVFEVKPSLKKENIIYAGNKAASVRKLYRTSAPIPYAGGVYDPKPLHRILSGILTITSGWKEPFGEPFKKCIVACDELQQVDCGCVLEGGAFFYDDSQSILKKSGVEESLVHFFLQLLILLQKIGTVPAIDLKEYMQALAIEEESINGNVKG